MSSADLPDDRGHGRRETMAGLAKGLAIVELLNVGPHGLTVADAARGAGTTRAAARRCLLTLQELGYVAHDGKYFVPLPRLRRLGGGNRNSAVLVERAQSILDEARDRLNEPTSLAVLDGRESLFIARAETTRMVSTGVRVGGRLPAYCSATGRILLGGLDDDEIDAYLRSVEIVARTIHTVTDRPAIRAKIAEARVAGVAYSDEELELGLRALAVPVRDADGQLIAACSLSTSTARKSLAEMTREYLPVVTWAASMIGAGHG